MNLRQLRYFCEIVEAGSAVVAASRLHVAPTALSMQIARLEEDLGGELFDRSRRPMDLTALGRYFHPRAKALLSDAKHLEDETRSVAAGSSGVLAIGYMRSAIFSILPRAIRSYRARHSRVKLELLSLVSEQQQAELLNGRIQISISRYLGPVSPVEGVTFTRLLDDPIVAALPAAHHLARRKSVRGAELDDTPLISYPKDAQSRFYERTVALLREAGWRSAVAQEALDIHAALGMVASGIGFCVVGRSVGWGGRGDVSFVPISNLKESTVVFAATRTAENSKPVLSFVDTLVATVRSKR